MPELLVELLSEEIPARMQARAAEELQRLVCAALAAEGLAWSKAASFATPRRLALVVEGLPTHTPDRQREEKGPRVGAPQQAIDGFLRKIGGRTLADCVKRGEGKAEHWVYLEWIAGRETGRAAAEAINDVVRKLQWPKSMRWPGARSGRNQRVTWVRPLRQVMALFGGEPLPGAIELDAERHETLPIRRTTLGHRFLSRDPIAVRRGFAEYRDLLLAAHVMLDPAERRREILAQAGDIAAREKLQLRDDPALVDEVVGLVEWPVALAGSIDGDFLTLPPEVLTTSMRAHQRYFALLDAQGAIAPRFVVIANVIEDKTRGTHARVVAGNERVLRARLADAKFFWDQDRKATLESRLPALAGRIFYAGLGAMRDKADRVEKLAAALAEFVPDCDQARARRAGRLAKCDLATGMVGEFPELQGVMGGHYARADGEIAAVADAIRDHYRPLGPTDEVPRAPVTVAVALADKLDTLVGFFAIGEKPTGSKDPFALRRAALGAIRLIVDNGVRAPLGELVARAHRLYADQVGASWPSQPPAAELTVFFADRLKVALREQGVRHDLIDAVFALGDEDDLVRLLERVEALRLFLKDENGANLLTAYRRAANIVAIEEKKDKARYDEPVVEADLHAPEELALNLRLPAISKEVNKLLGEEAFLPAMTVLAGLREWVDPFFDKVTVNDSDPKLRANRLRLLSRIRATLGQVADFSRIEG